MHGMLDFLTSKIPVVNDDICISEPSRIYIYLNPGSRFSVKIFKEFTLVQKPLY